MRKNHSFKVMNVKRNYSLRAFTMVEMIIAMAVTTMIMAFATLAYVTLYRTYMVERGYRDIHEDARKAIAMIDRDVRGAQTLVSSNIYGVVLPTSTSADFSTNCMAIRVPVAGTDDFNIVVYKTVPETVRGFAQPVGVLYRYVHAEGSSTPYSSQRVTRNPLGLEFKFYKDPGQLATNNLVSDTFEVRAYLTVTNQVLNQMATDRIQVRTKMRNKNLME